MKWGRRKDSRSVKGLSKRKRKLIEEGANLFPKYKGKHQTYGSKHVVNRNRVADDLFTSHTISSQKALIEQLSKNNKNVTLNQNTVRQINDRYRKEFISRYADATLKDLRIKNTPEAKAYVEEVLRTNTKVFIN